MATLRHAVETKQARTALVRHAGMKRISFGSVLAGTLVAYATFAVLLAAVVAIGRAAGFDTDRSAGQWRELGAAGAAALAVVVLICSLFGGYVAGRMARRAGATHGAMVFVATALLAIGVAGLVSLLTDGDVLLRHLRDSGIPATRDQWWDIGALAGAGSLAALLVGSVLGGRMGERWHATLLLRAADPTYGPEAQERAAAQRHRQALEKAQGRAAESHDESDDEVRQATAPTVPPVTAAPPGWYHEPTQAAAEERKAAEGDESDQRRGAGPRHRIRSLR